MYTTHYNQAMDETYHVISHKSGLAVYVIPKKMATAYALFGTKFGSVDNHFVYNGKEITLPDGIAHFLEHKMFENEDGTDTFAHFAKTGANANAYTTFERTCYLFSATENVLSSLEILLKFVTHPYFTKETVEKEQGIIGQEIGMYDDNPAWQLYFGLLTAMYHHNTVRIDTAGTVQTISQITPEILFDAYHAFYNLHNMALVVCGDVTPEEVERVCDTCLTNAEKADVRRIYPDEPPVVFQKRVEKTMAVSRPMFAVGVKDNDIPCSGEALAKKTATYEILLECMFGKSSRFYTEMFDEGLIDAGFSCEYEASETFAHVILNGSTDDVDAVYARYAAEVARYLKDGISREDFLRVKKAMYADEIRAFDSTEDVANDFMVNAFTGFDMFEYPRVIDSVTYEDAVALLQKAFSEECTSLSVIMPRNAGDTI